jgi:hypothetical protein
MLPAILAGETKGTDASDAATWLKKFLRFTVLLLLKRRQRFPKLFQIEA